YQTPKSSASGPKVGRNPPKMSTSAAAVRERDALARNADIVLQVLSDVVAGLEIGADRRLVIGLGDAAEDIVRRDPATEPDVPRIRWRRRRCRCRDLHIGRQRRRRKRDRGNCG